MSYLNVPRIHFTGRFQADPSTINNSDANFDPTVQFTNQGANQQGPTNTSVGWNPYGSHNWMLVDCIVRGAADRQGPFSDPGKDPVIGAKVESSGVYPAKLVDLDPDNQSVSEIYGLQITLTIQTPGTPTTPLASVTASMPPTAFCDLWNRTTNAPRPGMPTMSAAFQSVLDVVAWKNPTASALLSALQAVSPTKLSIRFMVDSYQPASTEPNFTYGRIVGTIGPAFPNEAPRSTPRRLAPAYFAGGQSSIFSTYGPAGVSWDAVRKVLLLDLGNTVPTVWSNQKSPNAVPASGWPALASRYQLSTKGSPLGVVHPMQLKSGAATGATVQSAVATGSINFDNNFYETFAGIVELSIPDDQIERMKSQPFTLTNLDEGKVAVQEDVLGRYVDVDTPSLHLDPGDQARITLWATRFGLPWAGVSLPIELAPIGGASSGGPWNNNDPQSAVSLSLTTIVTDISGKATLDVAASNPGTPRKYPNGQLGPDGQIYQITSTVPIPGQDPNYPQLSWPSLGQIFLFAGAPINLLVFSARPIPSAPTWTNDVGPILSLYARMYPLMKTIIDIGDYDTVVGEENSTGSISYVLGLPKGDPHYMPVVRDLSRDKLTIIQKWIAAGMPK